MSHIEAPAWFIYLHNNALDTSSKGPLKRESYNSNKCIISAQTGEMLNEIIFYNIKEDAEAKTHKYRFSLTEQRAEIKM